MNSGLGYSIIPGGQPFIQTLGGYIGVQQQQQQQLSIPPNSNGQLLLNNGAFPMQNFQPNLDFVFPNSQPNIANGSGFTCVSQNGMTYLAVTPNIQQQQPCYQAIQTPQGLQLIQVVNNNQAALNYSNSFSVPQQQTTVLPPEFILPQQFADNNPAEDQEQISEEESITSIESQQLSTQQEDQFETDQQNSSAEETNDDEEEEEESDFRQDTVTISDDDDEDRFEDHVEDQSSENLLESESQDVPTSHSINPMDNAPMMTTDQFHGENNCIISSMERKDPLAALTSLTSSIPSTSVSGNQQQHNLSSILNSSSFFSSQSDRQQGYSVIADPQFPPNTRAFQVLVPTPQGMAIQTVVASYPASASPLTNSAGLNSFLNLDPSVNPQLVNLPPAPVPESSLPQCNPSNNIATTPAGVSEIVAPPAPTPTTVIQVKDVTSPCHSTTSTGTNNEPDYLISSSSILEARSASVSLPSGSPHCYLPDSTDDLYQPTVKQSTSNIVDGIDLEKIREFARTFKIRRLALGLTQTQVGKALSATEGPAYSQSAICRFEKLDITPRSALKIRPVLENWLREAEEKYHQSQSQTSGIEYVHISTIGKIRKRRTFFSPDALTILNNRFDQHSHPSGREINNIANEIGYERDVVRVWFCNKRQSLRHCQTFKRTRSQSLLKSDEDSTTLP